MPYRLPMSRRECFSFAPRLAKRCIGAGPERYPGDCPDTLGAQTMDPILEGRAPHAHYQAPVFDSLAGFDYDKGGIGPGVAERWELASDGSAWTFFLRSGLKWHNGDPPQHTRRQV